MENWKKIGIQILVVIVIFSLLAELYYGSTLGYDTHIRGQFKDGLSIDGKIELNVNNLVISGEGWEANFHNISNIYIRFFDNNDELFEKTIETSNLTLITIPFEELIPYIHLNNITNNSHFESAKFIKDNTYIQLGYSSPFQINGTLGNKTIDDYLVIRNVILITDNELIEVLGRGWFFLTEKKGEMTHFNISLNENCTIQTYSGRTMGDYSIIGEVIEFNGELRFKDFNGNIHSKGRIYMNVQKLFGKMKLKITQNPETYYNHDSHQYFWAFEIEGKDLEVEGFGLPFWGLGLLYSIIPSIIILAYLIHKNLKEKKKNIEDDG
jgi:hypothetical protein